MTERQIQKSTDCITFIQSSRTGKLINGARSQNSDYLGEGKRWETTGASLWGSGNVLILIGVVVT